MYEADFRSLPQYHSRGRAVVVYLFYTIAQKYLQWPLANTGYRSKIRDIKQLHERIFNALEEFDEAAINAAMGAWWLSGKFGALHLQGRWFEPYSSRHVGILGKSFTRSCLYNVMWHPVRLPCS